MVSLHIFIAILSFAYMKISFRGKANVNERNNSYKNVAVVLSIHDIFNFRHQRLISQPQNSHLALTKKEKKLTCKNNKVK